MDKALAYEWEFGTEQLYLSVGAYCFGERLSVDLYKKEGEQMELFGTLTKNIPALPAAMDEAYIDDLSSKSKTAFIEKHGLGKVQGKVQFNFGTYVKVKFDLDRLSEFDKEGTKRYRSIREDRDFLSDRESGLGKRRTKKER